MSARIVSWFCFLANIAVVALGLELPFAPWFWKATLVGGVLLWTVDVFVTERKFRRGVTT